MTDKRDSDKPVGAVSGIMLMIAAVSTFAMLDATTKYTLEALSTGMVVCFRYGFAGAYVSLLADPPGRELYRRYGFRDTAPGEIGMALVVERDAAP